MPGFADEVVVGGLAVGAATCCTSPLDVIKVRLQLQRSMLAAGTRSPGLVQTGYLMLKHEGLRSLWKGLTPAMVRGFSYGGEG